MNPSRFFQQTAVWEARTSSDAYTGDTFASPVTINVRWYTENELVRNDEGREVTTSARISTLTAVKVGDRVTDEMTRERTIVTVRKNRDTRGVFSHYVAWLA